MKQRALTLPCAALALLLGACGSAPRTSDAARFDLLDRNRDGALSVSEALALPGLAARFETADGDADGKLSRTEFLQFMTPQSSAGGR